MVENLGKTMIEMRIEEGIYIFAKKENCCSKLAFFKRHIKATTIRERS